MKRLLAATVASLALAGCATALHHEAAAPHEVKMAFDVTTGNPQVAELTLKVVDLTRKQLLEKGMTPRIVVTFRGDASYFTTTDLTMVKEADRADALKVAAMLKQLKAANGIEALEQCNVPLAARKLKPTAVMQEVKLVPNGWIALANYQQQGYSYIVP